jgi:flavin reductase (DIM6/NTAB) family NADH-FMN oxidoreductase RutF
MPETLTRAPISIEHFRGRPIGLFHNQWFLLTCGDFATGDYNCMTISWGSLGEVWGRPFVQVFVRPVRYTYQYMEKYPTFTLCALPRQYHSELNFLGTRSGRDGNKLAKSRLTPVAAQVAGAPVYAEAELVIECHKMYWQDMEPSHFLVQGIEQNYPLKDYHRIYFGEILLIEGSEAYLD